MTIEEGDDKVVTACYSNGTVYAFTCCALIVYLNKGVGKGSKNRRLEQAVDVLFTKHI
jgi:hypothetical protein